jgi:hypothetical protein
MTHRSEADLIEHSHNTARFFVENRQVSLILLIGVVVWGCYGYHMMPKRKDPSIPNSGCRREHAMAGRHGAGGRTACNVSHRTGHGAELIRSPAGPVGIRYSFDQFSGSFARLRADGRYCKRHEEAGQRHQSEAERAQRSSSAGCGANTVQ